MVLLLFLAIGLFATAIPMSKYILLHATATWYVAVRTLLAGMILLGISFKDKQKLSWHQLRQDALYIICISIVLTLMPNMLKAYALKNLTSAKASFFQMLSPFFSAFFAYMIFGQMLTLKKVLGIVLGCAGFYILMVYDAGTGIWDTLYFYPCLAGLGAIASIRLGLTLMQHVVKKDRYTPSQINGLTLLLTGIISVGIAGLRDTPNLTLQGTNIWMLLACTLYVIVVGTVLWATFYGYCLKHYSVTFMALLEFSTPIFVSIYGWFLLAEPLTFNFALATMLTFIGLYIFYYDELAQEKKKPTTLAFVQAVAEHQE